MSRTPHPAWCILSLLAACGWDASPPAAPLTAPSGQHARVDGSVILDIDSPLVVSVGVPSMWAVTTADPPVGGRVDVTVDGVSGDRVEQTFDRPGTYDIVVQATVIDARGGRTVEVETRRIEVVEPAFTVACGLEPIGPYVIRCIASDEDGPAEARSFTWTLGDDRVTLDDALAATTTFDVSDAMDHGRSATRFEVFVADDGGREASTVVSLGSHVFLGREHGLITPIVRTERSLGCPLRATFEVDNPTSDATVTFTRFVRRTHSCDPDILPWDADVPIDGVFGRGYSAPPPTSNGDPTGPGSLELRPGESAEGTLVLACDAIEPGACATEYVLVGHSDTHEHVQTSLWLPHDDPTAVTDAPRVTVATLEALLAAGLLTDPSRVDEIELMALEAAGHVRRTSAGWEMN